MLGSRYPSAVCEQLAQEQAIFGVGLSSDSEISIKTKSWSPAYVFQYTVIDNKILIKFLKLFFFCFECVVTFSLAIIRSIFYMCQILYIHCKVRSLPD